MIILSKARLHATQQSPSPQATKQNRRKKATSERWRYVTSRLLSTPRVCELCSADGWGPGEPFRELVRSECFQNITTVLTPALWDRWGVKVPGGRTSCVLVKIKALAPNRPRGRCVLHFHTLTAKGEEPVSLKHVSDEAVTNTNFITSWLFGMLWWNGKQA